MAAPYIKGIWIRSPRFTIDPGEDTATNPGRYGKQLAEWLREKLVEKGYDPEPVIAEDWGWCVMCARETNLLWVGCGNVDENGSVEATNPPRGADIVWHCFVTVERPLFRGWFKKIGRAHV